MSGAGSGVSVSSVSIAIATLASPPDAKQKGTSVLIQTNENRLLEASFRNGVLWVAANSACVPAADTATRACLRLIKLSTAGGISKQQDFDFGQPGAYYYYPAVHTDGSGKLIAAFSGSSASDYAGVYVSGQRATDPVNTFQLPTLVKPEGDAYTPFANRWGDYSGVAIDPSNASVVWIVGKYARIEGGSEWGTFITSVQMQ